MKPLVILLAVGLFVQVFAQDNIKEPAALVKAREGYLKDILPITKAYVVRLEALKRELGGKGDVSGAAAVQAEIDAVKPADNSDPATAVTRNIIGSWTTTASNYIYTFAAGGKVTRAGMQGTWKSTKRGILVDFQDGTEYWEPTENSGRFNLKWWRGGSDKGPPSSTGVCSKQ